VYANRALVLIAEAIPPEQLDPATLRQRLADAEQRLADAEEGGAAYQQAERDTARAKAFLEVAESQ
jgi:F0F1-type ATP synthase epsilon subunit